METVYTVDSLVQRINDSVMEIGRADGMRKYLNVLANNPEFGLIESICLYIQYPQGKLLYSFICWKNQYGRHVKPDATGIKILEFDEQDNPKLCTVFDISQTEGKAFEWKNEKIQNKNAQKEFGDILNDEIKKQAIMKRIPMNSLLCAFAYYILAGYFCAECPELDEFLKQYSYDDRRYINAYLKELSELTGNVYHSLMDNYCNKIKSLAQIEPEKNTVPDEVLKISEKSAEKVATSQQTHKVLKKIPQKAASLAKHEEKPCKAAKKASVLAKLKKMQQLAKIYNEQRQG